MMDLFLTNMQFSTSKNWWTGLVWITCGLLWCFYQLFGLSFWRHPLTAEDLLVSKWCNATFLQICSHEEPNSSTTPMAWAWVNFQQMLIFGITIPLSAYAHNASADLLCNQPGFWTSWLLLLKLNRCLEI